MEPRHGVRILKHATHPVFSSPMRPEIGAVSSMPRSNDPKDGASGAFSRRGFIQGAASTAAALPFTAGAAGAIETPDVTAPATPAGTSVDSQTITLRINRQPHTLSLDPRTTLLDALRDHAGLTGTKKGCGHGQCGACTVHLDGARILSCLTFAVMAEGREITTIEGVAAGTGELHPMQQAFIDQDAFQCGYCTPGQIMSAIACVREGHAANAADIREYMSGNLCRCAAYPNIVAAIEQARTRMKDA
jgi:xanthine dehydrogenase YagT iron-sulfur-binding subunit